MLPNATIVTAFLDAAVGRERYPNHLIHELWPGRIPGGRRAYQWMLPFEAAAFRSFDTSRYDLVVSSSHAFAKAIRPGRRGIHLCYCHTPPRYLWDETGSYLRNAGALRRFSLRTALPALRRIDLAIARGVTHFLANSEFVRERIRRTYGRESRVLYGPATAKPLDGSPGPRQDFLLYFGRLVPYKRVDLVVAAANRLGVRTLIAGTGTELRRLQQMARPNVEFLGGVTEEEAGRLLETCGALVFCGTEDFGLVPVEANKHGAPVVAFRAGGVLESMVEGQTAVFFDELTVDSVVTAINTALSRSWDEARIRKNGARFSLERTQRDFTAILEDVLDGARW